MTEGSYNNESSTGLSDKNCSDAEKTSNATMEKGYKNKDKKSLLDWVDVFSKTAIAIAGLALSYTGYVYQKSSTASELLLQQEKGDTEIRAEMFGKITDRLMKPKENGADSLIEDALLAQVLALNFHELIELKPLLLSLDERLLSASKGRKGEVKSTKIIKIEGDKEFTETTETTLSQDVSPESYLSTRNNLKSIARRIRDRQLASLLGENKPQNGLLEHIYQPVSDVKNYISRVITGELTINEDSEIHYIGVGFNEDPEKSSCASKEINMCLMDVSHVPDIIDGKFVEISTKEIDWKNETVKISLRTNIDMPEIGDVTINKKHVEKTEEITSESDKNPKKCEPKIFKNDKSIVNSSPGLNTFRITNYDLPFTDNTLKPDGRRYSVFIDKICHKEGEEVGSLRLGLLYFPADYYPSRERPVSYKQLRKKLAWEER